MVVDNIESFKKKLGLEITSSKADGEERTYRITTN